MQKGPEDLEFVERGVGGGGERGGVLPERNYIKFIPRLNIRVGMVSFSLSACSLFS